jgi:hypothetical protein
MKYRTLPGTGLEVSQVCLGTMTWGEQNSESDAHAQLERAVTHGVNFIDTAEMYPVPPSRRRRGGPKRSSGAGCAGARARMSSSPPRSQGLAAATGYEAVAPTSRARSLPRRSIRA